MALLRGKLLAGALFAGALFGVVQQAQVEAPLGGGVEEEDRWAQTLVEHGKRIAEAHHPAPQTVKPSAPLSDTQSAPAVPELASVPVEITPVRVVDANLSQALHDRKLRETRAWDEARAAQWAAAMLLGMDPAATTPLTEEETAAYLAASWYFDGVEIPVAPEALTAEERFALEAALLWFS